MELDRGLAGRASGGRSVPRAPAVWKPRKNARVAVYSDTAGAYVEDAQVTSVLKGGKGVEVTYVVDGQEMVKQVSYNSPLLRRPAAATTPIQSRKRKAAGAKGEQSAQKKGRQQSTFSAFFLFMKAEGRPAIKATYPDMPPQEVSSIGGLLWSNMNETEKNAYKAMARQLTDDHKTRMEEEKRAAKQADQRDLLKKERTSLKRKINRRTTKISNLQLEVTTLEKKLNSATNALVAGKAKLSENPARTQAAKSSATVAEERATAAKKSAKQALVEAERKVAAMVAGLHGFPAKFIAEGKTMAEKQHKIAALKTKVRACEVTERKKKEARAAMLSADRLNSVVTSLTTDVKKCLKECKQKKEQLDGVKIKNVGLVMQLEEVEEKLQKLAAPLAS